YHLYDPAKDYPPTLFTTSTPDDRVHPGHARKMMAKMMEGGEDVRYYRNIEAGHGAAANNHPAAHVRALGYSFHCNQLTQGPEPRGEQPAGRAHERAGLYLPLEPADAVTRSRSERLCRCVIPANAGIHGRPALAGRVHGFPHARERRCQLPFRPPGPIQ